MDNDLNHRGAPDAMLETSSTTAALDEALAKCQGEIETATKDKINPAFRSKYADLASVWAACRPALAKHGLALSQWPLSSTDGRVHILTRLAHKGEYMQARFSVPVSKTDAHGYGSATTYTKRFMLSAVLGIAADDDDDGNGAAAKGPGAVPKVDPADQALVKGNGESQYQIDKQKKAELFVKHALGTLGLPEQSKDSLNQMWKDNARYIGRLEETYPDLHERLVMAFDKAMNDAAARGA